MTRIMIVDDLNVDRHLVGKILGKDVESELQYAQHGEEALAMMEQAVPDLVITDLVMPKVDGLELVATIREQHPGLPVILMTSLGSEDVAAEALRVGAVSYVPKRYLARDLIETVQGVLAVASTENAQTRLMECMRHRTDEYVIQNEPHLFDTLVHQLQQSVVHIGLYAETDCTRLGVALAEALANAHCHGNLGVPSELREQDDGAFHALLEERSKELPYACRTITVQVELESEKGVFSIRDEGAGFDISRLPDPSDPSYFDRPSGRGILLMKAFMDDVIYNATGNEVTLVKYRNLREESASIRSGATGNSVAAQSSCMDMSSVVR